MSFWTDIRDPLIGTALGGPVGTVAGLGYDADSGNGVFEPSSPSGGGDPYSGMPAYPNYNPIYDPSTQSLAPSFNATLNGINPDQSGINAYAKSALRTGPSPWAKMAEDKSYQDQSLQGDTLAKNNASNVASAQGNLALHGGSRSGAAERVATSGNTNLMGAQQQNSATGMENRSQIGINDEQNRIAQLGQLPGMQMAQADFGLKKAGMGEAASATDIQNKMLSQQSQNQFDLSKYQTQGDIWAANKQANATAASGSGSWICSESAAKVGAIYSRDERRALRILNCYVKRTEPDKASFYFGECDGLIRRMNERKAAWAPVHTFVKSVILQIIAGDVEGAYEKYEHFTRQLINQFWPDCTSPAYRRVA